MNSSNPEDQKTPTSSPLRKAIEHVKVHWIPFNREILKKLGHPSVFELKERSATILLIKQDLALFTYCLKELLSNHKENAQPSIPFELLMTCAPSRLEGIIAQAISQNFHEINAETSDYQDRVLSLPIISAVISEAVAPSANVDPQSAYLASLLRQLGLALIAWNYPTIFVKASKDVTAGRSIDKALFSLLGFSSLSLSLALARELHIADPIRSSMGEPPKDEEATQLKILSQIGEALARAEDPWIDPSAEVLASEAMDTIERLMGIPGMQAIKEALGHHCSVISNKIPLSLRSEPHDQSKAASYKTITVSRP